MCINPHFFSLDGYICDMLNSAAPELPDSHGKLSFHVFINSQTTFCLKVSDAVAAMVLCLCRKFTFANYGRWKGRLFRAPEIGSAQ